MRYDPQTVEPKWQEYWEKHGVFATPSDPLTLKAKPKYYILDMFPYPSGAGLHVGHPEGYTATDVLARMKRMQGFNVLHPMGWDAFGLPAERAAMRDNIHPEIITKRNVDNFRRQIKRLGFSYDWNREVSTADAKYYKWTQWIFLKLYEKGLAYLAEVPVNWCPALGTVLANEEVKDGKYIETGDPVERRSMKQWMLKITAYAERLLTEIDDVDWPEGVKEMQRNWIGKSQGALIAFAVKGSSASFGVFTTRPDTLFGCTYCVLAPEHPLLQEIVPDTHRKDVDDYCNKATQKTDLARTDLAKDKTGVFTGAYAVHPVTKKDVPIWVADYVLYSYGTGAIMAVPAHDERDFAFAKQFDLPIVQVIDGGSSVADEAYSGDGKAVNSDFLNGLTCEPAKLKMIAWLEENACGKGRVEYRLRDWLFSRQRYWGEPFPVVHLLDGTIEALPESMLPVVLPKVDEYKPTADGQPPLARASEDWLNVTLPDGRKGRLETNTMPQWAGSCWYYLRYLDANNDAQAWSPEVEQYWMPVDLYVGGVEHAVLHLLYARFWHKVLYDCGLVHTKEPFQKLFNQGMILAFSYRDKDGKYYAPEAVEEKNGIWFAKGSGVAVETQIEKMSKSKYNVVNPDDIVAEYGADSLRLNILFMGPLEAVKPWQTAGVDGVFRFLTRVWRLFVDERTAGSSPKVANIPVDADMELLKVYHRTLKKVTEDTAELRFNTAISQMMVLVNEFTGRERIARDLLAGFLTMLAPYAPHIAEELWELMGNKPCVAKQHWPVFDPVLCEQNTITIVLQVNSRNRDELQVPKTIERAELERLALAAPKVLAHLDGKTPKKVIVVPGKLVNIVV